MPVRKTRTENRLTSKAHVRNTRTPGTGSDERSLRPPDGSGSPAGRGRVPSAPRFNEVHVKAHRSPSSRAWLLPVLLGIAGLPTTAKAACSPWSNNVDNLAQTITAPAGTVTLAHVPMGEVMAKVQIRLAGGMGNFHCTADSVYSMAVANMSLPPSSQSNVYQTSVEGVGVRIGYHTAYLGGWPTIRYPPFESSEYIYGTLVSTPYYADVEFIRTGMAVGKGRVTFSYRADLRFPTAVETVVPISGTNLQFNLTQNSYYGACVSNLPAQEVRMGEVMTSRIQSGDAAAKGFSFTVDCDGMNVASAPTVKVYFEGDAAKDGWLNLQDAGKPGIAAGVGIELLSDKHVALPFARERAIPMDWKSKLPNGHRYGFSGTARHVPSGGAVTPGQADAHLVYVLEYN